jgi:hypothetical protein
MECKNEIQKYIKSVYYMKQQQQMEQEAIMPRAVSHWSGAEDPAHQFEASELTPATQNGSGAWTKSECLQEKLLTQSAIADAESGIVT